MRALAILAAIAMVVGLFMPWLNPQSSGVRLVPWDLLKSLEPNLESAKKFAADSPPELLAFLATFAAAALFSLLALIGAPSRLLAFLAGGGAVGMVGYAWLKMQDQIAAFGIPEALTSDPMAFVRSSPDIFGVGAFAWAGGAVILLFTALIGFGDR